MDLDPKCLKYHIVNDRLKYSQIPAIVMCDWRGPAHLPHLPQVSQGLGTIASSCRHGLQCALLWGVGDIGHTFHQLYINFDRIQRIRQDVPSMEYNYLIRQTARTLVSS